MSDWIAGAGWDRGCHVLRSPASLASALHQLVADKSPELGKASSRQQAVADNQPASAHAAAFSYAIGCGGVAIHMQHSAARQQARHQRQAKHEPRQPDQHDDSQPQQGCPAHNVCSSSNHSQQQQQQQQQWPQA